MTECRARPALPEDLLRRIDGSPERGKRAEPQLAGANAGGVRCCSQSGEATTPSKHLSERADQAADPGHSHVLGSTHLYYDLPVDLDERVVNSRRDEQRERNHDEQQGHAVEPEAHAIAPTLSIRTQGSNLIGFAEGPEKTFGGCRGSSCDGMRGQLLKREGGLLDPKVTASPHDGRYPRAAEQPPHQEGRADARKQGPRMSTK